ncbi:type VI secretion system protein TssA [Paraburkholderia hayleyella]|uniref:type VI secretion system protein TssA n=1 Tax=Paraburkholderia hayleyella TaxID=2152889 RepID=UPI0012909EB4|nr:type VI secretion system protein TssA [Paraburkholderia hayleyella]
MQQQADDGVQDTAWPQTAGGTPLSAALIAAYSRDCEPFAQAEAEIELLVAVSASRSTDWGLVARATTQVLTQQGKDLSAAVWLSVALLRTTGLTGLAEGVRGLRQMVSAYWDVMTPPVNRVRARDNQMQWLLDQLEACLAPGAQQTAWQPLEAALHEALLADWDALEVFWSGHHSDGPALFAARRLLQNLPVQEAPDAAVPAEGSAAATSNAETDTDPGSSLEPASRTDAATASSATATVSSTVSSSSLASSGPAASALPAAFSAAPLASSMTGHAEEARQAIEAALGGWSAYLLACQQAAPDAAFAYRLNRVCAWALIDTVPATTTPEAGLTRVPAPPDAVRSVLDTLLAGGDAAALVEFSESRLAQFPFWLDLCRYSHEALLRLGATQAAEAVAQDTRAFAARLSGLLGLQFADGQPFADTTTQRWLAAGRTAPRTALTALARSPLPDNASGPDSLDALTQSAYATAASGQLGEALSALEGYAQAQTSGRERFRTRLVQCELLGEHAQHEALSCFAAPLVAQIEAQGLAHWEPELTRRALVLAARASNTASTAHAAHVAGLADTSRRPPQIEQDRWVAQLASVDLACAWHLIFNADV